MYSEKDLTLAFELGVIAMSKSNGNHAVAFCFWSKLINKFKKK